MEDTAVINEELGLYKVKSSREQPENETCYYTVDILAGFCGCPNGSDGSPCKHQFAIVSHYRVSSGNFLPINNHEARRKYALIAHKEALPVQYYAGMHEKCLNGPSSVTDFATLPVSIPDVVQRYSNEEKPIRVTDQVSKSDTIRILEDAVQVIRDAIEKDDSNIINGVKKFSNRVCNMNSSQLATALHCFGSRYAHAQSKIKKSGLSTRKKSKRGGINVQSEAVKRRKDGQSKTRKTLVNKKPSNLSFLLPDKSNNGRKRKHDFTQIVNDNVPPAKKSGRPMGSRTRPIIKLRNVKKEKKNAVPKA